MMAFRTEKNDKVTQRSRAEAERNGDTGLNYREDEKSNVVV